MDNMIKQKKQKNVYFYIYSTVLCILLFSFHFYLYWPGYIQDDSQTTLLLVKVGWHPPVMAYLMQGMYFLFGTHVYHLFLLTLIPFYTALLILVNTAYVKTKSWWSLVLFFPCFIGNLFYAEIRLGSSSFSISWIFLLYALTLCARTITLHLSQKLKTCFMLCYMFVFLVALLSRDNAVLSVWPVTLVWILIYLNRKKDALWKYMIKFISYGVLSGISCLILLWGMTAILVRSDYGRVYPETPIVLYQIVAACAPEKDESCFHKTWWTNKWINQKDRMEKLKVKYEKNPLNSEPFTFRHKNNPSFNMDSNFYGLLPKWMYAITKYPNNYCKHLKRFFKAFWFLPADLIPQKRITETFSANRMVWHSKLWNRFSFREKKELIQLSKKIPDNERSVQWSVYHRALDTIIRNLYPSFNLCIFVFLNFIFFLGTSYLLFKRNRNKTYFMMFAVSCAGVLNSIVIPMFGPIIYSRYMEPVILSAVFNLQVLVMVCMVKRNMADNKTLLEK